MLFWENKSLIIYDVIDVFINNFKKNVYIEQLSNTRHNILFALRLTRRIFYLNLKTEFMLLVHIFKAYKKLRTIFLKGIKKKNHRIILS